MSGYARVTHLLTRLMDTVLVQRRNQALPAETPLLRLCVKDMTQRQQMSAGLNSLVADLGNQHQEAADATAALNGSISGLAGALAQAKVAVTETASNARGVVSDAGNHDDLRLATLKLQHETPPVTAQKTAQEVKAHPSPTRCAGVWGCAGLRSSTSRFGVVITTANRKRDLPL